MTVYIWRGIAAGWQFVGYRSKASDADRLITALRRVRPEFTYRQCSGWPEIK